MYPCGEDNVKEKWMGTMGPFRKENTFSYTFTVNILNNLIEILHYSKLNFT